MLLKFEGLQRHLQQGLSPLYVFTGDEYLLLQEGCDLVRQCARQNDFTQREIYTLDRNFKWETILNSTQTISLFGDKKIIELRIPTGRIGGREGTKQLQKLIDSTSQDNVIIITLPRLDSTTKKSAWVTALIKHAIYIDVPTITPAQLPAWINTRLKNQNQQATPESLAFIVSRVEGNLLAAHQEILKLGLLYPTGTLTHEQIKNAVLNVARYDIFNLSETILNGDSKRFMSMMTGLQGEGSPLVLMLWVFTDTLRNLLKFKIAQENNESLPFVAKRLRIWNDRANLFIKATNRFSRKTIEQGLQELSHIDRIVKGLKENNLTDNAWDALTQLGLLFAKTGRNTHGH